MIAFPDIATALQHPSPWEQMDRIVQRELNAGAELNDLQTHFAAWFPQIDELDLTEDGQDAWGETYEKIVGNCQPQFRY